MADDVLTLADRLWRGEVSTGEFHPVGPQGGLAEIGDGIAFVPAFANVTAVTTGDGLAAAGFRRGAWRGGMAGWMKNSGRPE
jgi:hypothetical protein